MDSDHLRERDAPCHGGGITLTPRPLSLRDPPGEGQIWPAITGPFSPLSLRVPPGEGPGVRINFSSVAGAIVSRPRVVTHSKLNPEYQFLDTS